MRKYLELNFKKFWQGLNNPKNIIVCLCVARNRMIMSLFVNWQRYVRGGKTHQNITEECTKFSHRILPLKKEKKKLYPADSTWNKSFTKMLINTLEKFAWQLRFFFGHSKHLIGKHRLDKGRKKVLWIWFEICRMLNCRKPAIALQIEIVWVLHVFINFVI